MRLLTATMPANYDLALVSDMHEGNRGCSHEGQADFREWLMGGNNRFFCHGGDAIEAITTDDGRYVYNKDQDAPIPLQQAQAVAEQYKPCRKRCLAWMAGNHEGMLHRVGDLTRDVICKDIGVKYGGRIMKLALNDRHGLQFKLFYVHPSRTTIRSNAKDYTQQQANKLARLKMLLEQKAGDCLVMGIAHVHQLLVLDPVPRLILADDGESIHQRYLGAGDGAAGYIAPDRRWYCATGSFLRSQMLGTDGYAEVAMYDPVELGYIVVEVRDRKVVAVRRVVGR